jgi:UPF0755 protein
LKAAARALKEMNLINNETFFTTIGMFHGKAGIKAGKYKISKGMSSYEILDKLIRGDILRSKVTIPEGFNIFQIAEKLRAGRICEEKSFLKHAYSTQFLKTIGISSKSAEGYLFPDTYIFPEDSNPKNVIKIMNERLKNILAGIDLANMKKFGFDTHQLLTFASLIEKEAKVASERKYISSVFHNRLRAGMRLDCDPTVRYAVKKFTGSITKRDLASESTYNTYTHYGLPPTAISSVGKESIIAALNPADSDYLYFVARNDGSHYFSKNYREHNRAVRHYQRGIKDGFFDRQRL